MKLLPMLCAALVIGAVAAPALAGPTGQRMHKPLVHRMHHKPIHHHPHHKPARHPHGHMHH